MLSSTLFDDLNLSIQWLQLQFIQAFNACLFVVCLFYIEMDFFLLAYAYLACFIIVGVGVFGGYHRLASHGNPYKLKSKFFVFLGVLAGSGPPVGWVATHHAHHKYSDTIKDPHVWERRGGNQWAPWRGVWLKPGCPSIKKFTSVKFYRDDFYRFLSKNYYTVLAVYITFLFSAGGFEWLFIGYAAPSVFAILAQTAIVSLSHRGGEPVNRVYLWPLMWGECFHKDHHENKKTFRQFCFDPLYYLV